MRSLSTSHLPFFRNRFRLSALTNDQCGVNLTSSLFFPLGSLYRRCLRGSSSHDGVLLPLFLLRTTAVPEPPAVRFNRLFLGGPICGDVNQKSNSWNRWMSRGMNDLSRCPSGTPFGMDTKSRKKTLQRSMLANMDMRVACCEAILLSMDERGWFYGRRKSERRSV